MFTTQYQVSQFQSLILMIHGEQQDNIHHTPGQRKLVTLYVYKKFKTIRKIVLTIIEQWTTRVHREKTLLV
jgi:hypothetical protein